MHNIMFKFNHRLFNLRNTFFMTDKKNVLLRLPPKEHRLLKATCATEGKSINEYVCNLIYAKLNKVAGYELSANDG